MRDTAISGAEPNRSFASDATMEVEGGDTEAKRVVGLLQWDLSELPPGAIVRSATISLYVVNETQSPGYTFFEAKRAWRFYEEGARLLKLVRGDSQASLWTLIRIYSGVLAKIEAIQYDVLAKPHPGLSRVEKAWIMLRAGAGLWKPGICARHT